MYIPENANFTSREWLDAVVWELGIVTLGVLIALAAQQFVSNVTGESCTRSGDREWAGSGGERRMAMGESRNRQRRLAAR